MLLELLTLEFGTLKYQILNYFIIPIVIGQVLWMI